MSAPNANAEALLTRVCGSLDAAHMAAVAEQFTYASLLEFLAAVPKEEAVRMREDMRAVRQTQQEEAAARRGRFRIEPFLDTVEELRALLENEETHAALEAAAEEELRKQQLEQQQQQQQEEEEEQKQAAEAAAAENEGEEKQKQEEEAAAAEGEGEQTEPSAATTATAAAAVVSPLDDEAKKAEAAAAAAALIGASVGAEPNHYGYTYRAMLTTLCEILKKSGGVRKTTKTQLPQPELERVGRRVVFKNFAALADALHRDVESLQTFFQEELSIGSNLSSTGALTMKLPVHSSNVFDPLLQKFVRIYVACDACRSLDTTLARHDRLLTLSCSVCGASRTVEREKMTAKADLTRRSKRAAAKA